MFKFLSCLFEFVTTKKFRNKLEVWVFHSLLYRMRLVIFKTDKSKGLDVQFDGEEMSYFQCRLPIDDGGLFLDQFKNVPHRLVYFDRPVRNFMIIEMELKKIEDYDGKIYPDMLIYFDEGDVLDDSDWMFLKRWFEDYFFLGRGRTKKDERSEREKYLLITNLKERINWEGKKE